MDVAAGRADRAAVDPAVIAGWAPALGLRLDAGALVVDRLTVRSRG